MRKQRALAAAGLVVALGAVGVGGIHLWADRTTAAPVPVRAASVSTATVTRTNLATTLSINGQLGYGTERPIKAGAEGQVTWLPKFGGTISRGQPVFRVNDQPVVLFYGRTPLFRRLDRTGLVGRDVKVVADNLSALGYSIGAQPLEGSRIRQSGQGVSASGSTDSGTTASTDTENTDEKAAAGGESTPGPATAPPAAPDAPDPPAQRITVRRGDAVLTGSLRAAIKRWQRDVGATPTGVLELGSIIVQPQRIRVSSMTGELGDPADSPLISVTRTAKVVTVSIKADQMESLRGAKKVTVTLPSGDRVKGRIGSIGRIVSTPDGTDNAPIATATITVDRPSELKHLDSAPVRVDITAVARNNVLAVPVGALLALNEGGYAIQVRDGALLPVSLGLFAKGLVEIKGDGITEGMTVVTTS